MISKLIAKLASVNDGIWTQVFPVPHHYSSLFIHNVLYLYHSTSCTSQLWKFPSPWLHVSFKMYSLSRTFPFLCQLLSSERWEAGFSIKFCKSLCLYKVWEVSHCYSPLCYWGPDVNCTLGSADTNFLKFLWILHVGGISWYNKVPVCLYRVIKCYAIPQLMEVLP